MMVHSGKKIKSVIHKKPTIIVRLQETVHTCSNTISNTIKPTECTVRVTVRHV